MQDILKALYQKQRSTSIHKRSRVHKIPFKKKDRQDSSENNSLQVSKSPRVVKSLSLSTNGTTQRSNSVSQKQQLLQRGLKRLKSIEEQQRIKRQIEKVKLPPINKQIKPNSKRLLKKFKAAARAALFISFLAKMHNKALIVKRQRTIYLFRRFEEIVHRMINNYYVPLLEEQISFYFNILDLKSVNSSLKLDREILSNIYYVTKKLSQSTIRKDFLELLKTVASNGSSILPGFFSQFEIKRLQLNEYGYLTNITKNQTRMIIGLFLCVKLLCSHIFYRPWNLQMWSFNTNKIFQKCQATISQYGSIYYYTLMQQTKKLPIIFSTPTQKEILKQLKIDLMNKINIYPSEYYQPKILIKSTSEDLISNQNHSYYKKMLQEYPQNMQKIKKNIFKWVDRIVSILGKEYPKIRSTRYTISQNITSLASYSTLNR